MQEDSRGVKVDRDRRKVLEGAGYDGRCPRTEENQRDVETNAQCRARGSGGQIGEEVEPEDVEGDWERQSDGDGVAYDGRRCRMDGATSGARGDSKRVDTRSLAEVRSSQQERRQRTMAHVPEPSTPLPNDPKRPTNPPNPPRRRGRLKTRPRRVSPAGSRKSTHQAIWSRRIRCICCIWTGDGAGAIARPRNAKTRRWSRSRPTAHTGNSKDLAEPRLAISGNCSSAAHRCHLE